MTREKVRYSDAELAEFETLIQGKLDRSKAKLVSFRQQMQDEHGEGRLKGLEDGTATAEMEYVSRLAAREEKHIKHLENALIRIKNKVYGVCRVTGKLIAKERLRAVPHATLSIEAKNNR